jgi:DNA-binding transcriptional LysR family regulator
MAAMDRLPDFEAIQGFLTVAETLSFRRGAATLNIDQSALSRRIAALEAAVGAPLFRRTTRDVRLTEAGQAFYDANRPLVADFRDSMALARRIAEGAAGRLRIGYMSFAATEAMPGPVRRFCAAHPDVAVELIYHPSQVQKQALLRRSLDAGFVIGPAHHPDLRAMPVLEERLVALVPVGHSLAQGGPVTLAALAEAPMVLGTMAEWEVYRDMLARLFDQRGLVMRPAFEASSTIGMVGLIAAGLGVTIYPAGISRLRPEGVVIIDIEDCPLQVQTALVWSRHGVSMAARNFLRLCGAPEDQITAA